MIWDTLKNTSTPISPFLYMVHLSAKIFGLAGIKANGNGGADFFTGKNLTFQELPDILFSWKIHSLAVELEAADLAGIDDPMLLELRKEKESDPGFALLFKEAGVYRLFQENGRETSINLGQIPAPWTGRALVIRLPENPAQAHGYRQGLIKNRFQNAYTVALAVLAGASSLFWIAAAPISARYLVLLALYATGAALSAILTKASFDTAFSEKTCKTVSGGKGCTGVLDSPAAKIGGWLSMGEIGLFYFAAMFLVLAGALYGKIGLEAVLGWLAAVSVLAALYPFFSVYYQWKIKSWCPICLAVQVVLLVTAVLYSPFLSSLEVINPGMAAWACFSFFAPLLAIGLWKPSLLAVTELKRLRYDLFRFRADTKTLHAMLLQTPQLENAVLPTDIQAGNPNAPVQVLIVSSPLCPSCRILHHQVKSSIEEFGEDVNFVFRISPQGGAQGAAVLREILREKEGGRGLEALSFWYSASFPQTEAAGKNADSHFDGQIQATKDWLQGHGITETPAIYVNGRKLPGLYGLSSLRFYLRDLILENI